MPRGIYPRTKNQLKNAKKNLAMGRTPKAREKARQKMIEKAKNIEWRKLVSEQTKKAMHQPNIRKNHLRGLFKARAKYGINFKGGNGQKPTPIIELANKLFSQCGFEREYVIETKIIKQNFENIPDSYKADFCNPKQKLIIEMDGPCHRPRKQRKLDRKKTKVLKALGWRVVRLKHQ